MPAAMETATREERRDDPRAGGPPASPAAAEALAAMPFFAGLEPVDLARVVPELEEQRYEVGEPVFCQGDPGDGLYLIRSGAAAVSSVVEGQEAPVAHLQVPAYFGEVALLSDEPRTASVIAATPLSVWKLPRERFEALVEKHPRLPLQLAAELARRLSETTRKLSESQHDVVEIARAGFDALDPPARVLLVRAAVFERFDADLLAAALGREWSAEAFEWLVREGGFLEPDGGDGWWRLANEPVREMLLEELRAELGDDGLRDRRLRAVDALLAHPDADPRDGLALLRAAEEWDRLGELLEGQAPALDTEGVDAAYVEGLLRALPDPLLWRRPALVRLLASCCAGQGKAEEALEVYHRAERRDPETRDGPVVAEYQRALADLYAGLGRHGEANACLRRAVELSGRLGGARAYAEGAPYLAAEWAHHEDDDRAHHRRLALAGVRGLVSASHPGAQIPRRALLALAVVALTAVAWTLPPPEGLSAAGLRVLVTVPAGLALTFLRVLPEYLIGLLMLGSWVASGTLPASVAAAGFASPTWFLLVASMALGTAVARSGLLYRGALEVVRRLPPSHALRCVALALLGVLFTPGMPSAPGRMALAAPLAHDIADSLRYAPRSGGSAGLVLAAFVGFGSMGTLFLTGNPMGLIAYGLFPPDVQERMSWGAWFLAALPPYAVLLTLTLLFLIFRYRPEGDEQPSPETIAVQQQVLGRLSRDEWSAMLTLVVLLIGFSTQSFHRVEPAWLAVFAVAALFLSGALDDAGFRGGVNVSFLLYLGVFLGLGQIFAYLEIDRWLGSHLGMLVSLTRGSQTLFVMATAALATLLSVLLRPGPLIVLVGLALYPTAGALGVSPWVVAFSMLLASNLFLYPQQNMVYLTAYHGTEERGFTHAQARPLAFAYLAFVFVAILVSIPYWRWLGLII